MQACDVPGHGVCLECLREYVTLIRTFKTSVEVEKVVGITHRVQVMFLLVIEAKVRDCMLLVVV